MKRLIMMAVAGIMLSSPANSKDVYIDCNLENKKTLVKIVDYLGTNKKVYFSSNGDWKERTVTTQNKEYIWVKSGWAYPPSDEAKKCEPTRCSYNFQISLVEGYKETAPYLYVHKIAANACVSNECRDVAEDDRIDTMQCLRRFMIE